MADTEQNKAAVLAFADAYTRADWDTLAELCTDDFRWVVPVRSEMQSAQLRAHPNMMTSHDRNLAEMLDMFRISKQNTVDHRFDLKIGVMTAEGDRVAAEAEGYAVCAATGRVYNNLYMYLMYFRDGKISVFREYQDTLHVYDVWFAP
jgi:ketosteroid isomerase-like protein